MQQARFRDEDGRPARRLLQKSSREVKGLNQEVSADHERKGLIGLKPCGAESMLSDRYDSEMCLSIFIDLSK